MNDDPLMGVPLWYQDIFPQGEFDGFYRKLGNHAVNYIERDPNQLVITFDNLAEAGGSHYARDAWAAKFIADNGWSHLGIFASGPTWFRDQRLIDYLLHLKSEDLFANYANVALAGTSMGAFGALAFAHLAPGSTVIAFSPQTQILAALYSGFESKLPQSSTMLKCVFLTAVGTVRREKGTSPATPSSHGRSPSARSKKSRTSSSRS